MAKLLAILTLFNLFNKALFFLCLFKQEGFFFFFRKRFFYIPNSSSFIYKTSYKAIKSKGRRIAPKSLVKTSNITTIAFI